MTCKCDKSYITVEEANEYFQTRYGADIWNTLSLEDKIKALVMATRKLDCLPYIGYKVNPNQQHQFPRYFVDYAYALDYFVTAETPQQIKDATAEEALSIVQYVDVNGEDALNGAVNTNMQSLKLGDASITYGSGSSALGAGGSATNSYGLYSDEAARLLSGFIKVGVDITNPCFYESY